MPSLIASVILLAYASLAGATTFQLESIEVLLNQLDPGLQLKYERMPSYTAFDLHQVGDSHTFPLFHIWTEETTVNSDDTAPKPIHVSLNFSPPDEFTGGSLAGSTFGGSFFLLQYGKVSWNNPVPASFANNGQVAISLSDEWFNLGLFGLNEGEKYGATINATVQLLPVDAPVPEPGTFLLLGTGLVALGVFGRKKCSKSAV